MINLPREGQNYAFTVERIHDRIALTVTFREGTVICSVIKITPAEARALAGELLAALVPHKTEKRKRMRP